MARSACSVVSLRGDAADGLLAGGGTEGDLGGGQAALHQGLGQGDRLVGVVDGDDRDDADLIHSLKNFVHIAHAPSNLFLHPHTGCCVRINMYTCILENKTSRKETSAQYLRDGGQEHEAGPLEGENNGLLTFTLYFTFKIRLRKRGNCFSEKYTKEGMNFCASILVYEMVDPFAF